MLKFYKVQYENIRGDGVSGVGVFFSHSLWYVSAKVGKIG